MTREEAIEILKQMPIPKGCDDNVHSTPYGYEYAYALDMAIEALKQPEIVTCKNCEYWVKSDGKSPFNNKEVHLCVLADYPTEQDDYCKYGEREVIKCNLESC